MPENFDALENAIKQKDVEEKAAALFSQARARLVLGSTPATVFFAALALRLKAEPSWSVETAYTEGKRIVYNPAWIAGMDHQSVKGVIAHEVMHVAMKHHTRCGNRDLALWNTACDLAVNPILDEAGLRLPPGRLMPGEGQHKKLAKGLSAEEYYALLRDKNEREKEKDRDGDDKEGEGDGDGQGDPTADPGRMGGVQEPGDGSQAAKAEAEADADVAVAQAEQLAKRKGDLPSGLDRLVSDQLRPKVDWREVLREFVSRRVKDEFRWSPSNRHFIHQEMYLPSRSGESLGEITIAIDMSGSIGPEEAEVFASEMQAIVETFPVKLTILWHDSQIAHVQEWEPSEGPLVLEPKGGGGTSHIPVFDHIAAMIEEPTCLICLTDLYTDFPERAPGYPVLWCVYHGGKEPKAPFGQVLTIED